MFEILLALENERTLALRFTMSGPSNLVEFLRTFGFKRDAARELVKGLNRGRTPAQVPGSGDVLYLKLL